jgi:hypothetical protein
MDNIDLFNAAVIGENHEAFFLLEEDGHLHAVEKLIAEHKIDQKQRTKVLEKIKEAKKALHAFARGKIEAHFLNDEPASYVNEKEEREQIVTQIHNIYYHLPHHFRNELSSLIHHKHTTM